MNGECDEDLYKVIPSLSLTRSVYLLTKYFKEYIKSGYMVDESSCATHGAANGNICQCCKYSSKLDEILTSLCKTMEDDTSDDVLSNAIQFVSYVAKDEFSVVNGFNYTPINQEFNSNNLGCCCCRSNGNTNCCCNTTGRECPCNTENGQCCQGDNCCCRNNTNGQCCCINGISTDAGNITLCDCCCKHTNGECTDTCKPVTENPCYCCCLCGDTPGQCQCETTPTALTRCCCNECGKSGCCTNCNCECNKDIKICTCCKCIEGDKLISCCELESKNEACTGKCCCSPKGCECKDLNLNGSNCNGLDGNGNCGNVGNYCGDNPACNLDICKISCCMRNLTTKTAGKSNGCLMTIISDMKNFYEYLERIKGCNGSGERKCQCPENSNCCCKTTEKDGKCCNLYCRVKEMLTGIFTNTSTDGKSGHTEKVSICQNGDKCIFCILCCLKNNATKIQTSYKACTAAGCCNITKCNITNTSECQSSGASQCASQCPTNGSCTSSTTTQTGCRCQQISPETNCCTPPPCSTCKISPSSIYTCIKNLYRLNSYHTIKGNSLLIILISSPESLTNITNNYNYLNILNTLKSFIIILSMHIVKSPLLLRLSRTPRQLMNDES